jgi:flavin reductase (DIM6/NTAB) family NADH-FMN oxidoreductase RutF
MRSLARLAGVCGKVEVWEGAVAESETIKAIMRMFDYGLFVATCAGHDSPRAATVSWATQVSFEPKQVAVALRKGTSICDAIQTERRFGLHVVGENQPELARAFFKAQLTGDAEISGYHYGILTSGVPILNAATAWLECEVVERAGQTGDHAVFIASVVDGGIQVPGVRPLALRDTVWHYGG